MAKKCLSDAELAEILAQSDSGEDFLQKESVIISEDEDNIKEWGMILIILNPPQNTKTKNCKWRAGGTFILKQHSFYDLTTSFKDPNLSANSTKLECFEIHFMEDLIRQVADECNIYFIYVFN